MPSLAAALLHDDDEVSFPEEQEFEFLEPSTTPSAAPTLTQPCFGGGGGGGIQYSTIELDWPTWHVSIGKEQEAVRSGGMPCRAVQ